MLESGYVRKQVLHMLQDAKRLATERRVLAADADCDGTKILNLVVAPVFKAVATALKTEGYKFRVVTPVGVVRLVSEASSDEFIEISLDVTREPPALIGGVSRRWGRRLLVDEIVIREFPETADFSEQEVLDFLLKQVVPFVER